jgi:hypothetical protein
MPPHSARTANARRRQDVSKERGCFGNAAGESQWAAGTGTLESIGKVERL